MNWYIAALRKYADFGGRARRSEYWYFHLVNFIISAVLSGVGYIADFAEVGSIYSFAVLVPSIAVSVRRLHDIGKSGWNVFLALIPIIGWVVLIVYHVRDGELGENEYGVNPKEEEDFQLYE
jgi:uncharacterized membrane protein YhaH (DUF805 family)